MADLIFKREVFRVVGAAMEVHRELGPGFLEAVYQEALEIELELRDIPFVSQPELPVYFKGKKLKRYYIPDFVCFNNILVEIKAMKSCAEREEAQILNAIRVAHKRVGLLLNFGAVSLQWKRYVV